MSGRPIAFVVLIVSLASPTAVRAQSLGELAAAEAKRKAASGAPSTTKTIRLEGSPEKPLVIDAAILTDPQRQAAIASLKALPSVTDGGANISEFKKYFLEAKIKTDALPDIPANRLIREVSAIYSDVVTILMSRIDKGLMNSSDVKRMKEAYLLVDGFEISSYGFFSSDNAGRNGNVLMSYAEKKLAALK